MYYPLWYRRSKENFYFFFVLFFVVFFPTLLFLFVFLYFFIHSFFHFFFFHFHFFYYFFQGLRGLIRSSEEASPPPWVEWTPVVLLFPAKLFGNRPPPIGRLVGLALGLFASSSRPLGTTQPYLTCEHNQLKYPRASALRQTTNRPPSPITRHLV